MKYFTAFIKPASSICNLNCRYCFYTDVAENRAEKSFGLMSFETAENLISRVNDYCRSDRTKVSFVFQGGEPMMAGLDFFKNFVGSVRKICAENISASFSVQTNGTLIDDKWCEFFKENDFLVGISFDGAAGIHDLNRVDALGRGTSADVLKSVKLLKKYSVEFNELCVVTRAAARHPVEVMNTAFKLGVGNLQLIPCLDCLSGEGGSYSLTPRDYASFLEKVCDIWASRALGGEYMSIRLFDNIMMLMSGQPAEQCGASGRCNVQFVVEGDGGVYPCDFYVLDKYRMGNVNSDSISDMAASAGLKKFLSRDIPVGEKCASCGVYPLCGGGCARYRAFLTSEKGYCPMQDFLYEKGPLIERVMRSVRGK